LQQLSGSNTLPQVFIGDHAVGGYTDTQAALKSGLLKKLLAAHQISLADGPLK
jgi:glutaredoxin 3